MLLGVDTVFVKNALPAVKMTRVDGAPKIAGDVTGSGTRFAFDYKGADTAIAINRLLKDGARVAFDGPSHVAVTGIAREQGGTDREGLRPEREGVGRRPQSDESHRIRERRHRASSTLPAWRCISPGPAATWTRAGRAGCSSSTSST